MKRALHVLSLLSILFSAFAVAALSSSVQAQKYYVVKGQIYDQSDKVSLPYAQVYVVGASGKGAVADIDGNYSLAVENPEFTIEVRYMSYTTRRMEVKFAKGEEVKVLNIGMGTAYQEMKSVEIKGQRIERDGKASVQSIEMVGVEQIAKNNVTTLDRALKGVAGLAIVDNEPQMRGGSGFSSGMGSRVMLLLDNMPMLRADAGRPTWNLVSMEDVEQIDVLKGAASVLYGSAAINGAINVHTKFATTEPKSVLKIYWGGYVKPESQSMSQSYKTEGAPPTYKHPYAIMDITDESWNTGMPMKAGASLTHSRRMTKWWDFSASVDYAYDDGYRLNGSQKTSDNFEVKHTPAPDNLYDCGYLNDPANYGTSGYNRYKQQYDVYKEKYQDMENRYTSNENRVQHAESRVRASLSNQFRINEHWTINLNGNFLYSHNFMYNFWANAYDGKYRPFGNVNDGEWATTLSEFNDLVFLIDPHVKYVSSKGGVHELDNRFMYSNNDVINIQGQDAYSRSVYNTYRYRKTFEKAARLALTVGAANHYAFSGGEVFSGNMAAIGSQGTHWSDNASIFAKLEKPFFKDDALKLELGGRLEAVFIDDWFEMAPVFQFGANYETDFGSVIRASVGQGYRAATIGERFITTRVGMYGFYPNPELKSEKSLNFELGWRQLYKSRDNVAKGYLDVAAFHQLYWNYIEFFMGPWNTDESTPLAKRFGFEFFNTGKATITGVEATFLTDLEFSDKFGMQIQANYTYSLPVCRDTARIFATQSSKDYNYNNTSSNTDGCILKYRIQHMAKLDVDFKFWKIWTIGVGVQYMSAMRNVDKVFTDMDKAESGHAAWLDNLNMALPFFGITEFMRQHAWGSVVLDLRTSVDLNRFTLSFVVNNVLNAEYSLRPLYIEAPLNFNLQVVYRFQDINPFTWFHRKKTDVAAL